MAEFLQVEQIIDSMFDMEKKVKQKDLDFLLYEIKLESALINYLFVVHSEDEEKFILEEFIDLLSLPIQEFDELFENVDGTNEYGSLSKRYYQELKDDLGLSVIDILIRDLQIKKTAILEEINDWFYLQDCMEGLDVC